MIRVASSLLLAAAVVVLGGCVSLLPTSKPVQLYELTPVFAAPAAPPPLVRTGVRMGPTQFEPAAAGDRFLTVKGAEAAFIGGARWVAPAQTLVETDVARAFAARATRTRLVGRFETAPTGLGLSIDVTAFHVRYEASGPPSVEIALQARLWRLPDRAIVVDRRFEATRLAASNSVSAIVVAYDEALAAALSDLVAATDAAAG